MNLKELLKTKPKTPAPSPAVSSLLASPASGPPVFDVVNFDDINETFKASNAMLDETAFSARHRENIETLRAAFDTNVNTGTALRQVMAFIQSNPNFEHIVSDNDMKLLIAALRVSTDFVFTAKLANQTKATNRSKIASAAADIFKDFEF